MFLILNRIPLPSTNPSFRRSACYKDGELGTVGIVVQITEEKRI